MFLGEGGRREGLFLGILGLTEERSGKTIATAIPACARLIARPAFSLRSDVFNSIIAIVTFDPNGTEAAMWLASGDKRQYW
jgi:hypothetical protein